MCGWFSGEEEQAARGQARSTGKHSRTSAPLPRQLRHLPLCPPQWVHYDCTIVTVHPSVHCTLRHKLCRAHCISRGLKQRSAAALQDELRSIRRGIPQLRLAARLLIIVLQIGEGEGERLVCTIIACARPERRPHRASDRSANESTCVADRECQLGWEQAKARGVDPDATHVRVGGCPILVARSSRPRPQSACG